MKAGYIAELQARKNEFEDHKLKLEGFYMNNDQEDVIEKDPNLKAQFEEAVKSVDKLLPTFATTLKSVKMAVETRPIMENLTYPYIDQAGIFPPYLHIYVCDHFGMSIYGLHSNPCFFLRIPNSWCFCGCMDFISMYVYTVKVVSHMLLQGTTEAEAQRKIESQSES